MVFVIIAAVDAASTADASVVRIIVVVIIIIVAVAVVNGCCYLIKWTLNSFIIKSLLNNETECE